MVALFLSFIQEPLLRSTPLYSIPGNHEIECDNTTNQVFEPYEAYFRNPNRLGPADRRPIPDDYRKTLWSCLTSSEFLGHYDFGNAFWSVDHGLAKLIGLNSYTSTVPGSPQYTWLDHELQHNVDRAVTPWLIITFHCPLHTSFRGHNGEVNSLLMLKSMEPLFVQYQVNLVVSGHDHAYLRTKPMRGSTAVDKDESGPIYLTLGAGGNREQHNKGYIHDIPEEWVAKRDISEYGFGHLHLPNATHAHLTWVRDGTTTEGIRDSVWLSNQYYHH
jgi:DNA repair exonuclease SbcCD nuclease subunit